MCRTLRRISLAVYNVITTTCFQILEVASKLLEQTPDAR
jgi:hypothetical protein